MLFGVIAWIGLLSFTTGCDRRPASTARAATLQRAITALPGRIEAENYNTGGEGVGYHTGRGDYGTAHPRPDSMDISANSTVSGGYDIGWIAADQWFMYDISVSTAGTYTASPRITSPWVSAALHVEIDGVNVTGSMSFSKTSGWVSLPPSQPFPLTQGTHTLKVYMEQPSFNLDAVDLALVSSTPPPETFLRGVNFGGTYAAAITVGGHAFVTDTQAQTGGLTIADSNGGTPNAWQTSIANGSFVPAVTDTGLGTMLNSHISATNLGLKLTQAACNGTYHVYTYHMENNASNWRSFTIKVQGASYDTVSLAQYNWKKYGPYTAVVSNATSGCNGTLNVELVYGLRDASIMGLEVYTTDTGNLPALGAPPETFLRGVNFGGTYASAVTAGGHAFVTDTQAQTGGLTIADSNGGTPNAWQTSIANGSFVPAVTDAGLGTMLNSHISATNLGLKLTQAACNGTYHVYTYHMENNASNWRSFTIKVQGALYDTVSLAQYNWKKYGPYTAIVSNATSGCNGTLNVELVYGLRDASIMGLEVYTTDTGSLPALGTPGGPPPSPYVPPGYVLTFYDEFEGTSLDRTKWKTRYIYNNETLDFLNDEQERYRDNNNQIVSNGTLKLTAYKVNSDPSGINYESGMIRSTYLQTYGYFEARVRLPDGKGVWPAFWLNSDYAPDRTLQWPPEIDIFEYVINGVEDTPDMVHTGVVVNHDGGNYVAIRDGSFLYTDPAFNTDWTYYRNPGGSLANQWQIFGLEWNATTATTYLNGKKLVTRGYQWKYDNGQVAPPAHILLNLAIGGASWAGRHGIDDSKFPQALEIDYVRVYSKP